MTRKVNSDTKLSVPKWMEVLLFLAVSPDEIYLRDCRKVMGDSFHIYINKFEKLKFVETKFIGGRKLISLTNFGKEISKSITPLVLYVEDNGELNENSQRVLKKIAENPVDQYLRPDGLTLKGVNDMLKIQKFLEDYSLDLNVR